MDTLADQLSWRFRLLSILHQKSISTNEAPPLAMQCLHGHAGVERQGLRLFQTIHLTE